MPVVFFGASPFLLYSRHSPLLAHYRLAAAVPQVEVVEAGLPEQAVATAPQVAAVAGIPQVEVAEVPREAVGVQVMGAAVLQQEGVAVANGGRSSVGIHANASTVQRGTVQIDKSHGSRSNPSGDSDSKD